MNAQQVNENGKSIQTACLVVGVAAGLLSGSVVVGAGMYLATVWTMKFFHSQGVL